jgi:hypothetical protein
MSELPMRGHFPYLRFKIFPMTPRTPQCEVFYPLLSNSGHSGVPKDSKSQLFQVLGFTPTLGQSRGATLEVVGLKWMVCWLWLWSICLWNGLLFHLTSFCYLQWASSGLDVIWLWFQLWSVCSSHQIPHF